MTEIDMSLGQLAWEIAEMKRTAILFVERHAAIYARDVPIETVRSICNALGDISIDEACAALDRLQREGSGNASARSDH